MACSLSFLQVQCWICQESGLKSVWSLKNLVKLVEKDGTWRKKRKIRLQVKFHLVNQTIKEIYADYGGELSQLTIKELCRQRGISCSSQTIHRVLSSSLWKRISKHFTPINTDKHREMRLEFCNKFSAFSFGGQDSPILWIDIDEKNFVNLARKMVYVPKELEHTVKWAHVASNTPL
jgi:hypothetical protein